MYTCLPARNRGCKHLFAALLLAPGALIAQTAQVLPLYTDSIPNSRPVPDQERSERTPEGIFVISKVSRPALTLFHPDPAKANGTAVIICPGGGYWVEAADLEGTDFAKRFAADGVLGIVLKYRIPADETMVDRSIGALQDAQQALKVVREHASDWGINPGRIGIMGFSAGGHLAAMAATHFEKVLVPDEPAVSVRPDFVILGYPVITCSDSSRHAGSCEQLIGRHPTPQQIRWASNEWHVTDSTPPAFLVHATDDDGVPAENSILFYQALLRHHVPAELHLYEHSGHGFGIHLKNTQEDWMGRCFHWMEANGWMPTRAGGSSKGGDSARILMVGNSITYQGDWRKVLGRTDVTNWGIPGYTSEQLSWTIKNYVLLRPEIVFLEGGINDLTLGIAPERVFGNQVRVIDSLQHYGIIPVVQSTIYQNPGVDGNRKVKKLNKLLRIYCSKAGVDYLDLNAVLSPDGFLKKELTTDGTHLRPEAYLLWAELIKAELARRLK